MNKKQEIFFGSQRCDILMDRKRAEEAEYGN
jgi:hypothetical protein